MTTLVSKQTDALRRLPPYVFAELERLKAEARTKRTDLLDLGIGSPDMPMGAGIVEALSTAAHQGTAHGYPPFRGLPAFFESIERFMQSRFGVEVNTAREMVALSGAKEGLAQLVMATCAPGDIVLVPAIYYPVYARATWLTGAEVSWVPMRAQDGFQLDLDAISEADARRAKLMIVNYPNNPTGARVELEFYQRAVDFARRHDVLLISDLAYSELTFDGTPAPSALEIADAKDVTIEFHSFSKTFSMAGLRIGFAVGNADAIEALAAYRTNVGYGTPTVVQQAAAYALDHRDTLVPPKVQAYRDRRDAMTSAFHAAGWDFTPPSASMYLWLPVPKGVDDWIWVKSLMNEDGIVVTPGVAFGEGGTGYFRISLVRDAEALAGAATRIAARRAQMTP
ncbi:MAG: aminotransferase class I/II-fold pyridoxal phosphate-dependent enzyme [Gemmatimonadota bacterium]|nr:aminotransferase class I/II-fold pyridoxal phosphate-dependent enzyme [Gemmatimonadota bacterium]